MLINQLGFKNFRNLKENRIDTSSSCVVFSGVNASGKTSLLEAIYSGLLLSSFRTHKIEEVIAFSKDISNISIEAEGEDKKFDIKTCISRQQKNITINSDKIKRRGELLSYFSIVPLVYNDKNIVSGEPKDRRRFFDMFLSFIDEKYYECIRAYKNILKERNAALKTSHFNLIGFYDIKLSQNGFYILEKRRSILNEFTSFVNQIYKLLFNINIGFEIDYKSDCKNLKTYQEYMNALDASKSKDFNYLTTSIGVHGDDFILNSNNKNVMTFFSTGQIRLLSIILRLAEIKFISEKNKKSPVILVDDVLLELDEIKKSIIFSYLCQTYEQAFWTFIKGDDFYKNNKDVMIYSIENGDIKNGS